MRKATTEKIKELGLPDAPMNGVGNAYRKLTEIIVDEGWQLKKRLDKVTKDEVGTEYLITAFDNVRKESISRYRSLPSEVSVVELKERLGVARALQDELLKDILAMTRELRVTGLPGNISRKMVNRPYSSAHNFGEVAGYILHNLCTISVLETGIWSMGMFSKVTLIRDEDPLPNALRRWALTLHRYAIKGRQAELSEEEFQSHMYEKEGPRRGFGHTQYYKNKRELLRRFPPGIGNEVKGPAEWQAYFAAQQALGYELGITRPR